MIASPTRAQDLRIRYLLLECIEICVRIGRIEEAKEIGANAKIIKERIERNSYPRQDAVHFKMERILNL